MHSASMGARWGRIFPHACWRCPSPDVVPLVWDLSPLLSKPEIILTSGELRLPNIFVLLITTEMANERSKLEEQGLGWFIHFFQLTSVYEFYNTYHVF